MREYFAKIAFFFDDFFRDAMPEYHPQGSQDFDEYWHDSPHIEDFSWLD